MGILAAIKRCWLRLNVRPTGSPAVSEMQHEARNLDRVARDLRRDLPQLYLEAGATRMAGHIEKAARRDAP